MFVEINKLEEVYAYLKSIESVRLEDIVWMRNGDVVEFTKEEIEDWKFTGLNNRDFVLCGPWQDVTD